MKTVKKLDPTRSKMLRESFVKDLRKRFKLLAVMLYTLIVEEDSFGLNQSPSNFSRLVGNAGRWSFLSTPSKLTEFTKWLSETTGLTIVSEEDRFWESYIEKGYEKGAGRAYADVSRVIKSTDAATKDVLSFRSGQQTQYMRSMLGAPETIEKVQLLVSRTFTDLQGMNSVMINKLKKELVDGLVKGDNPKTIAVQIAKQLDISRYSAERIARTEIIRAHAEGQLDSMQRMGLEKVGVQVEWQTAGDDRVCPICLGLGGEIYEIQKAHGLIPAHPNCRCAFVPYLDNTALSKRQLNV